jgi:glycosyltransferase involved in cell wall biosynthesis
LREEKENILVSVIILTYNHEKYVGEAVNSVLEQEFDGPCELLIGDDASKDETPRIIESIEDRPNWVINRILREENVGMQLNFLDLLERASGKYIAFCDGDDYWTDSNKLKNQYRLWKPTPTLP